MVFIRAAVFALFVGSAFGQFPSPLIVAPPANTDPSCVRLYEQRTNGNNFLAVCAPNAITTTTSFSFPNLVGAQMATQNYANTFSGVTTLAASVVFSGTRNIGTAAAPANDFYATNHFGEIFYIAAPATTFGTLWSLSATASAVSIKSTTATGMMTWSGSGNYSLSFFPLATASYDLGDVTSRWRDLYFSGKITQNGVPRVDTSGNFITRNISPETHATYSIGTPVTLEMSSVASGQLIGADSGSVIRYNIIEAAAGSNAGAAITIKNAAGTNTFETRYNGTTNVTDLNVSGTCTGCGGGGGVTSLAATSPVTTTGATGAITIGCATCIVSGFTTLTGDVGSGQLSLHTQSGAPSGPACGLLNDGTVSVDITGQRLYVCIAGTPYYTLLIP